MWPGKVNNYLLSNCQMSYVILGSSPNLSNSRLVVFDSLWPHMDTARLLCSWNYSGKNTGVGCHFLLQGIFLIQGSNKGLLHCRQILLSTRKFSSVQSLSRVRLFGTPWTAAHQASLSITNSRVYSNSCPLSQWCHPIISSSVIPFFSYPQSFPASGSFPVNWLHQVVKVLEL